MRRFAKAALAVVPVAVLLMTTPAAASVGRDPVVPDPGAAAPTPPPAPDPMPPPDLMPPPDPMPTVEQVVESLSPAQSLLAQLGLFGVPASPDAPSSGATGGSSSSSSASASASSAGSAGSESGTSPIARRTLGAQARPVTGTDAVLRLARSSTALIALLIAAVVFLLVQGRLDRRAPQLASAPLDRRQELLEFS